MNLAGRKLLHYDILDQLGEGGMGVVYKAFDTHLDRYVAIKVLPPGRVADQEHKRRFVQEAKAASALNHPNIITIHDIAADGGMDFIVMEFIPGRTLDAVIGDGLPLSEALRHASSITDALAKAHSAGIIHRDLKPSNIMIDEAGHAKILDFGLVKLIEIEPPADARTCTIEPARTTEGALLGTMAYMSPEQASAKPVDQRSDLFSFGSVLYEMISRKRAFTGDSAIATLSAVIRDEPRPLREFVPTLPAKVESIVRRCMRKNREERYSSASALLSDLEACRQDLSNTGNLNLGALASKGRHPAFLIPAILSLAAIGWGGMRGYRWYSEAQWASTKALREIQQLIGADHMGDAYKLAVKAEPHLKNDPEFARMWPLIARTATIETTPPGAEVFRKDYATPDAPWELLGRSPLTKIRLANEVTRWKIQKETYLTVEGILPGGNEVQIVLDEASKAPAGMVHVRPPKREIRLQMSGFETGPRMRMSDFWLDRNEVTNRQFKQFVDQSGYRTKEYWKQPFRQDGRDLSWEEAQSLFRDVTGQPGPAGWVQGEYPSGQDDYPVSGISWYEAAAYAQFVGKSLPTVWHWSTASGIFSSAAIVPASNFSNEGPAPVGKFSGIGPAGTNDMAGNVKEWSSNEDGSGKRYILGGGWDEPTYMFSSAEVRSPFTRERNFGFRCVQATSSADSSAAADAVKTSEAVAATDRDYSKEKPCSDEMFRVYKGLFKYDRKPLNAKVENVSEGPGYRRERITLDAAYGNERLIAFLYLPNARSAGPLQAVVLFPGSGLNQIRDFTSRSPQVEFLVKSGRAVIFPMYKGILERSDEMKSFLPDMSVSYRDHVIAWSKDIGRSLDYLETRPEIDSTKVGFSGFSWGAAMAPLMTALDERLKVSVLALAGFYSQRSMPEVDQINYVSRVRIPTLMLGGRYDSVVPLAATQLPMFHMLGTSPDHKRHMLFDSAHIIPLNELIKESLSWFDRYLGPVK